MPSGAGLASQPVARVPLAARTPCAAPVTIPTDIFDPKQSMLEMSRRVARSWGTDREALGDCAEKNRVLAAGIAAIEEAQK